MPKLFFSILIISFLIFSCQSNTTQKEKTDETSAVETVDSLAKLAVDTLVVKKERKTVVDTLALQTMEGFLDIEALDPSIFLDIRYATEDNFDNQQIYNCPKCYLRPEVAKALVAIQAKLQKKGLGLLLYDCYRPRPMQQKLWDAKPDPRYVSPPHKGSDHGRGAAVDLTLIDESGKLLDMGTAYDFFGKKAWHAYTNLPDSVLANRKILKTTMEANGFRSITSEWWHYALRGSRRFPLSEALWPCPE